MAPPMKSYSLSAAAFAGSAAAVSLIALGGASAIHPSSASGSRDVGDKGNVDLCDNFIGSRFRGCASEGRLRRHRLSGRNNCVLPTTKAEQTIHEIQRINLLRLIALSECGSVLEKGPNFKGTLCRIPVEIGHCGGAKGSLKSGLAAAPRGTGEATSGEHCLCRAGIHQHTDG